MSFLDIILSLPLIYGLYTGYSKGLISQITGLIGGIIATLLGVKLSGYTAIFLTEHNLINPAWAGIVGFVVTIAGIILTMKLAGAIVRKTTKTIGLGFIERIAGGVFGFLKWLIVTLVLLFFFVKINSVLKITPDKTFDESKLYVYYQEGFKYLHDFWKIDNNTNEQN